ncbi:MAG: IS66 family insertion sequence element accessory protein TnpA, partial [Pseudomonadota bacterium]
MTAAEKKQEGMFRLLDEWKRSGQSQKEFCQEQGVAYCVFHYWYKRYRQQRAEAPVAPREGIRLPYSTLTGWISGTCALLEPLYDTLKKEILSTQYLQADETPIKVLDRDRKGTTHRGYHWVYHAPEERLVLFDYREGRGREGPTEVLKDFRGYLQA